MVAAIARYHRRGLPKKRHESWQLLESREQRRTVSSMALLLRLAAALDRRPAPVLAGLRVRPEGQRGQPPTGVAIELLARQGEAGPPTDLSLERWSLQSCRDVVLEASGLQLIVREP
jgi:exopolyphosphatase/guanosine-5'-triphosphate,3'-diphosphate pyrophosphatase